MISESGHEAPERDDGVSLESERARGGSEMRR